MLTRFSMLNWKVGGSSGSTFHVSLSLSAVGEDGLLAAIVGITEEMAPISVITEQLLPLPEAPKQGGGET